jgi:hypothetical protein
MERRRPARRDPRLRPPLWAGERWATGHLALFRAIR